MAQRRVFGLPAIVALPGRSRPQPKEPRSVPSGAGNGRGDFGKAGVGLAVIGKPISDGRDPVTPALPCPDQLGARLDPTWQLKPTIGLCYGCLHQLIEQATRRYREAAIGLLLDPMRNAPP